MAGARYFCSGLVEEIPQPYGGQLALAVHHPHLIQRQHRLGRGVGALVGLITFCSSLEASGRLPASAAVRAGLRLRWANSSFRRPLVTMNQASRRHHQHGDAGGRPSRVRSRYQGACGVRRADLLTCSRFYSRRHISLH